MSCKSGDGLTRVFGSGAKVIAVALKQDEAVAEYAECIESSAEVIGNGAQVFADNHQATALALERQDAEEVLEIVADIGTIAGAHAVGNPVEAGEPHDMIEAYRTGRASRAAYRFDEIAVAGIGVALRMEGGEAPVLAIFVEVVRRRAYANLGGEEVLVGPVVGTDAVGCKGEIVVEAERKAESFDAFVREIELLLEVHFDEGVEFDLASEFDFESAGCGRIGGLKFSRPMMPVPGIGIATVEVSVESHVSAVVLEPWPAGVAVSF